MRDEAKRAGVGGRCAVVGRVAIAEGGAAFLRRRQKCWGWLVTGWLHVRRVEGGATVGATVRRAECALPYSVARRGLSLLEQRPYHVWEAFHGSRLPAQVSRLEYYMNRLGLTSGPNLTAHGPVIVVTLARDIALVCTLTKPPAR